MRGPHGVRSRQRLLTAYILVGAVLGFDRGCGAFLRALASNGADLALRENAGCEAISMHGANAFAIRRLRRRLHDRLGLEVPAPWLC